MLCLIYYTSRKSLSYFVFLGWFSALNISLLDLPSVWTLGDEICIHYEVSIV